MQRLNCCPLVELENKIAVSAAVIQSTQRTIFVSSWNANVWRVCCHLSLIKAKSCCVWAIFHGAIAIVTCWCIVWWDPGKKKIHEMETAVQKWWPGCSDAHMGYHRAPGMSLSLISLSHFLYRNPEDSAKTACLCWQPLNNMAVVVNPHIFCHLAH